LGIKTWASLTSKSSSVVEILLYNKVSGAS
jgi:hypothetical protein